MAIPDISFVPMEDYHLLRGQKVNLLDRLRMGGLPAAAYMTANPTVSCKFTPLYLAVPVGTAHDNADLKLKADTSTGLVEAEAGVPAKVKRNFIVEAEAKDSADNSTKLTSVRIHIHDHVTQAWLTPPVITLRQGGLSLPEVTLISFSVRAQFDDDVVGDVTDHKGIVWSPASNVLGGGGLRIDAGNTPGSTPVEITATLPASLEGKQAKGHVKFAPAWSAEPNIQTDIVPGGGWPGTINPSMVPNILFLCDGYTAPDAGKFEGQVNGFVELLKKNSITRPFNLLATSMNIWKAFVPSAQRGISFLCEMYFKTLGSLEAQPVPNPLKAPDAGNWTIQNLVYAVGLPVMTDGGTSIADLKTQWGSLVSPLPLGRIPDSIIGEWKALGSRTLLEEQDSALGLAYGLRPGSGRESDNMIVDFHPERMNRTSLDKILKRLYDTRNGTDISDLWDQRPDMSYPNSYRYVFIFSSAKWDRGANFGRGYIAMNVEDRNTVLVSAVTGKNSYEIDPVIPIRANISAGRMIRGAHELAHSFNLGDEYNEKGTMDAAYAVDDYYSNLQKDADVRTGADIDGDKIKWRWHRIKKAAVIAGAITEPTPGKFKVPLLPDQGNQFVKGETVLLRIRKFPRALKKDVAVLAKQLEVDTPHEANAVTLKGKGGVAVTLAELNAFPAESIAYVPVDAPASVLSATYPFAELVAKNIKDHITARKRALNVDPAAPQQCPGDKNSIQMPVKLTVDLPVCFSHKSQIVGLYTGGALFECGVYHPAGSCIMRNSNETGKEFCAVCSYILVDTINPYEHWQLDREYGKIYPLK